MKIRKTREVGNVKDSFTKVSFIQFELVTPRLIQEITSSRTYDLELFTLRCA